MRTAPSAIDWQETDIYVVMKAGTYVYDAVSNTLKPDVSGDYRALTGMQPFVKDAPITLVYVTDASRMVIPQRLAKTNDRCHRRGDGPPEMGRRSRYF